ncbi:hypothetical protein M3Y99_00448200 [Aphelenchoides fujianensis]|nr:hypothetical protein M3Y99_00448200 [Aphelenchoides fujianensis]
MEAMRFEGRVVIVTGSSSGIGRAVAEALAAEGVGGLTLHGQNAERLAETRAAVERAGVPAERLLVVRGPIEEAETRRRLVDETLAKFGRLDVLVNNAASQQKPGAEPNSLENLDFLFAANLRAVVDLTARALPHLRAAGGNVVNVSSVGASRVRCENVPYVVLKAALDHFTRNAAIQHAADGVRVNAVSPGATRTNFPHTAGVDAEQAARLFARVGRLVPVGRVAEAREVAAAVLFVASPAASYVTGSTLVVDGGLSVGNPQHTAELAE